VKNITKIIKLSKPLQGVLGTIAFLVFFNAVLQQVFPVITKFMVDEIESQIKTEDGDLSRLMILVGIGFAIQMFGTVLESISNRLGDHFAGRLRKFLTEKFYDKVFRLPQNYFDSEISGKIVNQLNRGIFTIQNFSNTATNFILPTILQSVFTIVVLAYYNWPTAVFVTVLFPIYLGISYLSTKEWGKKEVEKNKFEDAGRGRIQEVISNIRLVKAFNNQKNEYNFIENTQTEVNKIYAKQSRTFHIFDFLRNTSLNIVLLGINLVVFYNAFQGSLSIGEVVLIIQLVIQARRPLFAMSFLLTQVQMAESGSKEYFEILDLQGSEEYSKKEKTQVLKDPVIEFKNVDFNYKGGGNVIKDMSFKIEKNEKIALVGHSGAGKSTIINLILKFYDPTAGNILISGKNYKDLTHNFVRNQISLVFQDNELFSSTVRENVAYGMKASEEEIIKALKMANAYGFVRKFKKGLDSEIGERGVKLSGGQKQRIQIARAILHDSPILILDEATSSLDSKSETLIQEALENLMKDKLVIIIAHRFSTIQNVDRIMVVSKGKIVDQGDPKELSGKKGIYSELLRYQIEGNKKLLKNYELY
jgi:ATP-binding cassette subfamily B protein